MKKSTPALSHEPPKVVAGEKNDSLAGLIEPYADGQFAELPEGVCERVIEAFSPDSRDELMPFQRRSIVWDDDVHHDPVMRSQLIYFFELSNAVALVESDITELELIQPQSITEKLAKENKLSELHDKLNKLQALEKQPAPVVALSDETQSNKRIRYEVLASRTELIQIFSLYGVELKIFKALKDRPGLMAARRVKGKGQKGSRAEPMFCPFEVINWLVKTGIKEKPRLENFMGWHILETKFPSVYAEKSIGDPRQDSKGKSAMLTG